ncbi:MAG: SurA N-terminal domain-containing protein [Planctomycetota bacterium]
MLRKFQKYEKQIMFGLVIVTALAFGITGQMLSIFDGGNKENQAGEIMGRGVGKEKFQQRRRQCELWVQYWLYAARGNYIVLSMSGYVWPADMVDAELYNKKKEDYIEELTWVALMMDALADKYNVKVSPNEVVDYIKMEMGIFRENWQDGFSKEQYQRVLSSWGVSEVAFEEMVQEFIKLRKYRDLVMAGLVPNTREVYEEFLAKKEEAKIAWLAFDTNDYLKDAKLDDEDELLEYFQEHSADYEVPQKVQIEYIMAEADKFREGLPQPAEDALQNYYNRNREKEFQSKAFAEVRDEIRNKLLDESAKEQSLERITKAEERITLLELQQKEVNLKEIARQFNLNYDMTSFIALDNIEELEKILGSSSLFRRQAATFQENELSRAVSTDKGNFIFRLLKKQGTYIPKLTGQIKEKATRDFLKHKANQAAKTSAHKLLQNISEKVNEEISAKGGAASGGKGDDEALVYEAKRKWFNAFTKDGMQKSRVAVTAFFQKEDNIVLAGAVNSDFKEAVFKMKRGEIDVIPEKPDASGDDIRKPDEGDNAKRAPDEGDIYYVVQVVEKRVPASGNFDAERQAMKNTISGRKRNEFNKNWLEDIKKQTNWKKYENTRPRPQEAPVPLDY